MTTTLKIILAIGLFVGGWVASYLWNRPGEDWRIWKERAEQYQAGVQAYQDSLQAIADRNRVLDNRLLEIAQERDSLVRVSDKAHAAQGRQKRRADSLVAVLAAAGDRPAEERLALCTEALEARSAEATDCERARAGLVGVIRQDSAAMLVKDEQLANERQAHALTRRRLFEADSLVQTAPPPAGCGLPFCAALSFTVEPWDQELAVGVTLPVGWQWLRLGAHRNLTRK